MLSRVFTAARNLLPFQRSVSQGNSPDSASQHADSVMVTTRGQSGSKGLLGSAASDLPVKEDIPRELRSPGPGRKRRRAQGLEPDHAEEPPTPSSIVKRQKKLPVRTKEEDELEKHTHFYAEVPVNTLENTSSGSEQKNHGSPEEDIQSQDENDEGVTPDSRSTTAATFQGKSSPVGKPTASLCGSSKAPKSPKAKGAKTADVKQVSQNGKSPAEPILKPKHKRFGSEDPVEILSTEVTPEVTNDSVQEDENSDDDAPEVVATHDAQEKALAAAREASKVLEKKDASARQKRKERDAQLKIQARSGGKKQKSEEDSDVDEAVTKATNDLQAPETGIDEDGESETLEGTSVPSQIVSKPKLDRANLPAFLPAEYLSDTEDPVSSTAASTSIVRNIPQNKKTKFLDLLEDRTPKDIVKGSTTYRVAESGNKGLLAPKADKRARSTKEAWLQGRNGRSGPGTGAGVRKKVGGASGGFFVNADKQKKKARR